MHPSREIHERILYLYSKNPFYHQIRKSILRMHIDSYLLIQLYNRRHLHNQATTIRILLCPLVSNLDRVSQVVQPPIFVHRSKSIKPSFIQGCKSPCRFTTYLILSIQTSWRIRILMQQSLTTVSFIEGKSVHLCNRCQYHRESHDL